MSLALEIALQRCKKRPRIDLIDGELDATCSVVFGVHLEDEHALGAVGRNKSHIHGANYVFIAHGFKLQRVVAGVQIQSQKRQSPAKPGTSYVGCR